MINIKEINKEYNKLENVIKSYNEIDSDYNIYLLLSALILPLICIFCMLIFNLKIDYILFAVCLIFPSMFILPIIKGIGLIDKYNKKIKTKIKQKGFDLKYIDSKYLIRNKHLENFYKELENISEENINYINNRQKMIINFNIKNEYQSFMEYKIEKNKITFENIKFILNLIKKEKFIHSVNKEDLCFSVIKSYINQEEEIKIKENMNELVDIIEEEIKEYKNKEKILEFIKNKIIHKKKNGKEILLKNEFKNLKNMSNKNVNKVIKSI